MNIDFNEVKQCVSAALREDVGPGCLSSAILPNNHPVEAKIIAKEAGILCGQAWVNESFQAQNPEVSLSWQCEEGELFTRNQLLVKIKGPVKDLLIAERTALNFLQTLSATATITNAYVEAIKDYDCHILDTRKTIPGLRYAQKYATRIGGARNHRMGLYDAFLIKENHLKAFGSIKKAIDAARAHTQAAFIEVEVETLEELKEAIKAGPHRIMLDNFSKALMQQAVSLCDKRIPLEASGNVSLDLVADIAATGVDYISVGAITKNIQALDLSLLI